MKLYKTSLATAVLTAVMMTTFAASADAQPALKDVQNHWASQAITSFYQNHYINGDMEGNFNPDANITREDAAAILSNMVGTNTTAKSAFTDVQGRWSESAIATLSEKHIINGYADSTFLPANNVTREEFAVIAYNYLVYKGVNTGTVTAQSFADENEISSWAEKPVGLLASMGYIKGHSGNVFDPKANITRAEAVEILYRISTGIQNVTDERSKVESAVFKVVDKEYGSIENFTKDGVMYWQAGKLHVAVKNDKKRVALAKDIQSDTALSDTVIVQRAKYSKTDYDDMISKINASYIKEEGSTTNLVRLQPDLLNEKVLLIVKTVSQQAQQSLTDKYKNVLKIVIAS